MGKKKHRSATSKGTNDETTKKKPMKDPDPTSREYMHDDIDMFHLSQDKILLDTTAEKKHEESDLEENLDEEVLPLRGDESSSDDEYEDVEDEEDAEQDEEEDEDGDEEMFEDDSDADNKVVSDKAWGRGKKIFYNTDVQDDDIFTSDEEAELAAEEEEKEAMVLQKRLAEQLENEDFYTFDEKDDEDEGEEDATSKVTVAKDLSKLSTRERLEILAEESPELLPLLDEYREKLEEVRERYHPLVLLVKHGIITNRDGAKFIELKHQLLLNYLVNISFYLALKSSNERTKGHPVINVLVQHQQIFAQMKPFEEKLEDEITEFLTKYKDDIKNGTLVNKNKDNFESVQTKNELDDEDNEKPKVVKSKSTIDPLEYYNMMKSKADGVKKAKKQKLDDPEVAEGEEENANEAEEGGKRMITYEMSKNKGLIRKRRKELKNPRVKHKMKFKKAIIKRKGQVREVQREINRYGGETTGIKCSLARSTKIK